MFPWFFFAPPKPLLKRIAKALEGYSDDYWHSDKISTLLKFEGVNVIGAGCYGVVVEYGDKVIKLFGASDEPYLAFLDLIAAHPCKYFPKVFERGEINDRIVYVVMERLEVVKDWDDDLENLHNRIVRGMDGRQARLNKTLREATKLLFVTSCALNKFEEIWLTEDLHTDNVMLRGETLVITDPWC